jgi:spoIIIJ-associated protein
MKKIEAPTLEEAYEKAAEDFGCSVVELKCEIVQYPSAGILGLFKKPAIIIAAKRDDLRREESETQTDTVQVDESDAADEIVRVIKNEDEEQKESDEPVTNETYEKDAVVERFFKNERMQKSENVSEDEIVGDENTLARTIEEHIKHLMDVSCFDIDVVEVDVADNIAYIFIDGEDAALLIGKEGYRYNALSYMLFNWINATYGLFIKLEIAQFYTSQQEMIRNMLQPLIEEIRQTGRGRTRFLDGILVQIALEQLREAFPDKYVAIKTARNGQRFVVVNDFYTKPHV